MRSSEHRLRAVVPKASGTDRLTAFLLLMVIPVIAGGLLALWQSEIVTNVLQSASGTFDNPGEHVVPQRHWFRRS